MAVCIEGFSLLHYRSVNPSLFAQQNILICNFIVSVLHVLYWFLFFVCPDILTHTTEILALSEHPVRVTDLHVFILWGMESTVSSNLNVNGLICATQDSLSLLFI